MADQQSTERRTSAVATAGGAHPGVLLPYAYPGTRLGDPALDDRRALDPGPSSSPKTVKDVSRQTVKHVLGLDIPLGYVGVFPAAKRHQVRAPLLGANPGEKPGYTELCSMSGM